GLDHGRLGPHVTLPLGPLRVGDAAIADRDVARALIDQHLETVPWIEDLRGRNFYAVGGAWRSLARIHMEQIGHPLHIIQQYRIDRGQAENLLRIMSRLGRRSLAAISGLSRRRLDTLPFAALLLERLLRRARPDAIVFSASGLREGYVFSELTPIVRRQDPLLAAARDQVDMDGRFGPMGDALEEWTRPLFSGEGPEARRLRHAVCLLSDIAWRDHPDYRAEQCFDRILRLPSGRIGHAGRGHRARAALAHRACRPRLRRLRGRGALCRHAGAHRRGSGAPPDRRAAPRSGAGPRPCPPARLLLVRRHPEAVAGNQPAPGGGSPDPGAAEERRRHVWRGGRPAPGSAG